MATSVGFKLFTVYNINCCLVIESAPLILISYLLKLKMREMVVNVNGAGWSRVYIVYQ